MVREHKDLNLPAHRVRPSWDWLAACCHGCYCQVVPSSVSAFVLQHGSAAQRLVCIHSTAGLPSCCLPAAAQVMVANIRCSEIMADQLDAFKHDPAWVRAGRQRLRWTGGLDALQGGGMGVTAWVASQPLS